MNPSPRTPIPRLRVSRIHRGPKAPVKRDLAVDDQLPTVRQNPAYHFVIALGGKPLADDVGLFVYTSR